MNQQSSLPSGIESFEIYAIAYDPQIDYFMQQKKEQEQRKFQRKIQVPEATLTY